MNVQSKLAQGATQAPHAQRPQGPRAGAPAAEAPNPQPTPAPRPEADGAATVDVGASLDRLDAYAASISDRVRDAFADAGPEQQEALREAMELIQSGLDRVRHGIESGTMAPGDIQRGTSTLYDMVAARISKVDPDKGTDAASKGGETSGLSAPATEPSTAAAAPASAPVAEAPVTEAAGAIATAPEAALADAPAAQAAGAAGSPDPDARALLLDELSGLGAQLQALLGESLFGAQTGQIYGLGELPESIAPRERGLDLSA